MNQAELKRQKAFWMTHANWLIEFCSQTPDEPGFRSTADVVNEELEIAQDRIREINEQLEGLQGKSFPCQTGMQKLKCCE